MNGEFEPTENPNTSPDSFYSSFDPLQIDPVEEKMPDDVTLDGFRIIVSQWMNTGYDPLKIGTTLRTIVGEIQTFLSAERTLPQFHLCAQQLVSPDEIEGIFARVKSDTLESTQFTFGQRFMFLIGRKPLSYRPKISISGLDEYCAAFDLFQLKYREYIAQSQVSARLTEQIADFRSKIDALVPRLYKLRKQHKHLRKLLKARRAQIDTLLEPVKEAKTTLAQPWIQLWDVVYAQAQQEYIDDTPSESQGEVRQLLAGLHDLSAGLNSQEVSRLNKVFGKGCFRRNIKLDEYIRYQKIAQQKIFTIASDDFFSELAKLHPDPERTGQFMQLIIDLANAREKE